jgi:ABC-type transport system, involved in lipoprotein release, permease component
MNSFNIACNNFKRNLRTYGLYLMAMIFSVVVYYNFVSLKYNPDFIEFQSGRDKVQGLAQGTAIILLVFLVFFIWFSSSFFMKQRKNEIGIYTFMGVGNYQIAAIFAIELIFIGIVSIAAGLGLGVLFGRLFNMLLVKVSLLNISIRFFVSVRALVETSVTFLAIFAGTSVKGYVEIARSRLIDLFNASKKEEQLPKVNYITGMLSIIIIGAGYYFAKMAPKGDFLSSFVLSVVLIIAGTYLFFGSFVSMVVKFILNKKKILYRGVNIVSLSNIAFRIKGNYRTLAAVAILVTTTVTAFGTVSSLRFFVKQSEAIEVPYSFTYISGDQATRQKVEVTIKNDNRDIFLKENIKYLYCENIKTNSKFNEEGIIIVKASDFQKVSRDLNVNSVNSIVKYASLRSGEALLVNIPSVKISLQDFSGKTITANGKDFHIKKSIKTPLFGTGVPYFCLIVNDGDYETLKPTMKELEFNGIRFSNQENSLGIIMKLAQIDNLQESMYGYSIQKAVQYDFFGTLYFIGAFLSLVFILATGSIIYFKIISEAVTDKSKFDILARLGMSREEAFKSVSRQVGISFALPLIVGIVHSCVAISVLSRLMNYNIIYPAAVSIAVFAFVYGLYFAATTRKFMKMVL